MKQNKNAKIKKASAFPVTLPFEGELLDYGLTKRDNVFSHGETLEKAIDDLKYKISDKDISKFNSWKENTKKEISLDEAIRGYRTITGACEYGVKSFVNSIQAPELLTTEVVLKITDNMYGNDVLKGFLEKK